MTTNIQTFAGNIGIGTNDPGSYKLNVNGSVQANSLVVGGVTNSEVPVGMIALWYGTVANIPDGWTFCNGTAVSKSDGSGNITPPNLRDKFILGATADSPTAPYPGQTGGNHSTTLSTDNLASHAHSVTVNDSPNHQHGAGTNGAGSHGHGLRSFNYALGTYGPNQNTIGCFNGYRLSQSYVNCTLGAPGGTNAAPNHTHGVNINSGGAHAHNTSAANAGNGVAFDNRAAYYVLAYIMKI
jgi:hypothetical protein